MFLFRLHYNTPSPSYRWLGEKYDGIRCCWNHQLRRLYPSLNIQATFFNILSFSETIFSIHQRCLMTDYMWLTQERYSRVGNELLLVPELVDAFPPMFLDCEIWYFSHYIMHLFFFCSFVLLLYFSMLLLFEEADII